MSEPGRVVDDTVEEAVDKLVTDLEIDNGRDDRRSLEETLVLA